MSAPAHQERLLTFTEARELVEQHARGIPAPPSEQVELLESLGRVLAAPLPADRDLPPFHRATRDGYAVRAADLQSTPAELRVVGEIKAGDAPSITLGAGECAAIMTGAPLPAGADAVVMVEYTEAHGDRVVIQRAAQAGENFVPAGSEARAGQALVESGTRCTHTHIAVAAATGCTSLEVYRRPRVAILPTGDEIVEVGQQPAPTEIRNSNSCSLAAQVAAAGGEPWQLPIAPDEPTRLRALIEQGLQADLLLLSGGVSAGKYDLVEPALAELGAEFFFRGVLIQPGRPLVFGRARGRYFLGLPGNPISTMVTFELFARAVLDALSGASPAALPFASARLARELRTRTGLTRFLPARLSGGPETPTVELVPWQGSGDLVAVSRANCYVVVPPDRETIPAGEAVTILLR